MEVAQVTVTVMDVMRMGLPAMMAGGSELDAYLMSGALIGYRLHVRAGRTVEFAESRLRARWAEQRLPESQLAAFLGLQPAEREQLLAQLSEKLFG